MVEQIVVFISHVGGYAVLALVSACLLVRQIFRLIHRR